jgi:hypothetical protein
MRVTAAAAPRQQRLRPIDLAYTAGGHIGKYGYLRSRFALIGRPYTCYKDANVCYSDSNPLNSTHEFHSSRASRKQAHDRRAHLN